MQDGLRPALSSFENPPVGPIYVPYIVAWVLTAAVDWWGDHTGQLLGHFVLRVRGLVVVVGLDSQCPLSWLV